MSDSFIQDVLAAVEKLRANPDPVAISPLFRRDDLREALETRFIVCCANLADGNVGYYANGIYIGTIDHSAELSFKEWTEREVEFLRGVQLDCAGPSIFQTP